MAQYDNLDLRVVRGTVNIGNKRTQGAFSSTHFRQLSKKYRLPRIMAYQWGELNQAANLILRGEEGADRIETLLLDNNNHCMAHAVNLGSGEFIEYLEKRQELA